MSRTRMERRKGEGPCWNLGTCCISEDARDSTTMTEQLTEKLGWGWQDNIWGEMRSICVWGDDCESSWEWEILAEVELSFALSVSDKEGSVG